MSLIKDKTLVENYTIASTGDMRSEVSTTLSNNISTPTDITGLLFPNASVRSFSAQVSVAIDATADLYEVFTIDAIQRTSDWVMNHTSVGDDSGVTFSITTSGQLQYTSQNLAGHVSTTLRSRSFTTSV